MEYYHIVILDKEFDLKCFIISPFTSFSFIFIVDSFLLIFSTFAIHNIPPYSLLSLHLISLSFSNLYFPK